MKAEAQTLAPPRSPQKHFLSTSYISLGLPGEPEDPRSRGRFWGQTVCTLETVHRLFPPKATVPVPSTLLPCLTPPHTTSPAWARSRLHLLLSFPLRVYRPTAAVLAVAAWAPLPHAFWGHFAVDPRRLCFSKAIRGRSQAAEPAGCHAVHPGDRVSFFFPLKTNKKYIYIYLFFHVELRQNESGRTVCGSHQPPAEGRDLSGGCDSAGGRTRGRRPAGAGHGASGPALGQRPHCLLLGTRNLREGGTRGCTGRRPSGRCQAAPPPCRQSSPHFCHLPPGGGLPGPQPWPTTVTSPPPPPAQLLLQMVLQDRLPLPPFLSCLISSDHSNHFGDLIMYIDQCKL